jgi:hypothetical protein
VATPPLSNELALEARDAFRKHGAKDVAARALNLPPKTFRHRLKIAAQRGMMLDEPPAMPGFVISKMTDVENGDGELERRFIQQKPEPGEAFEVPAGHVVKGVSALLDPDGRELAKWVKTREGIDPLDAIQAIKDAFSDYPGRSEPVAAPVAPAGALLTLLPCNDWHIGMYAWGRETEANWDLSIAEETIGRAVVDLVARTPSSGTAVVLGGGDLTHSDNKENRTAKSGNVLDVDGRYPKVVETAARLKVRTVDACLARHQNVLVRILPGNHDEHTAIAIAYFLLAWYRDEPRVTVDVDPSLFWWHRFGRCLLGATHGHTVKIKDMPAIMAHRRAEDWGATKHRYVHGFHLHHSAKFATEGEGVISEIHQAPIPQDAWHFGAGFLSGRSLQAVTYHADHGEISRVRTAIMDADHART